MEMDDHAGVAAGGRRTDPLDFVHQCLDEEHAHTAGVFLFLHLSVTSSEFSSIERMTLTESESSSLLPCSMALMQASATAVLRSSTRSSLKPMSRATLAAVFMATFS